MQFVQFMVFLILFIAYLGISIYHNDPHWTTGEMIRQPAGQAAVVLESLLMILMFGQVRGLGRGLQVVEMRAFKPSKHLHRQGTAIDCKIFKLCSAPSRHASIALHRCPMRGWLGSHLMSCADSACSYRSAVLVLQAADELKQMVTYKKEYFDSPWNYMDVASCVIIAVLFLLHVTRLSNQVGQHGVESNW